MLSNIVFNVVSSPRRTPNPYLKEILEYSWRRQEMIVTCVKHFTKDIQVENEDTEKTRLIQSFC